VKSGGDCGDGGGKMGRERKGRRVLAVASNHICRKGIGNQQARREMQSWATHCEESKHLMAIGFQEPAAVI
jgi:hypothetical protein